MVVDHLTFSSGVEVTLLGVGISRDDDARPWKPDGTPLDALPEGLSEPDFSGVAANGQVYRQLYQRTTTPENLPESVAIRSDDYSTRFLPAGISTVMSGGIKVDENETRFDIEIGVAAGPWEPLAKTRLESGIQGVRDGVTYDILVGKPFKRDDDYLFTLTHTVTDLDERVVVYDTAGEMHYTPATGMSPGINDTRQGEYSLDGVAPEEVRFVELQVREFEWRTFRNIVVNPEATLPPSDGVEAAPATQDPSTSEESQYSATSSSGIEATIVAVGEYGDTENFLAWTPSGKQNLALPKPNNIVPHSSDSGPIRRVIQLRLRSPEESIDLSEINLGFQFFSSSVTSYDSVVSENQILRTWSAVYPAEKKTTSIGIKIAAGPWTTVLEGPMNGHASYTDEMGTYESTFKGPYTKDGETLLIASHTTIPGAFRLVAFDAGGSAHALTRRDVESLSANITQSEWKMDELEAKDITRLELQTRNYDELLIENIALYPDDSDATVSVDNPPVATPPVETVEGTESVPPFPSEQDRPGWLQLEFRAHELLARSEEARTILVRNDTRLLRVESDETGVEKVEDDKLLRVSISGGPSRPARYGLVAATHLGTRRELERTNGLTSGLAQITTEYILQRSWDGGYVGVPALIMPSRLMQVSDVWRTWRSANDSRTMEYTDNHGWRFVAQGAGWSPRRSEEIRYPLLSLFESYRPDGTLYSRTELTEGRPDTTRFFATNGTTLDGQTRLTWNEQDGTASLMDYTWRTGNGQYRRYVGTPNGVIHEEEVLALVDGEFLVQERLHHAPDNEIHVFELDMDEILAPLVDFREEAGEPDPAAGTDA